MSADAAGNARGMRARLGAFLLATSTIARAGRDGDGGIGALDRALDEERIAWLPP